jgi:hypothetical protein
MRLHLDVGNPNVEIKVIEDGSPSMPSLLADKEFPFVIFYDESFNELFTLEQHQIEFDFENVLTGELEKISNSQERANI